MLFVRLVIPEFGTSNGGPVMDQGHMWLIALIRDDDASLQRQHAHLLSWLEGVVIAIVVGHRWREILRGLIQPFVMFLVVACFAMIDILLELGPQSLIGGPNRARDIASHLWREFVRQADT